jgi:hypothetical protein
MNAKLAALAATGIVAAVAVPTLTSAQGPAVTQFAQRTLTFTEKDTNDFAFIDHTPRTKFTKNGPRKLSNGDQLVFRSTLVDEAGARAGALDATCMITGAGNGRFDKANSTCHATVSLRDGQLFLQVGGKPFASDTTSGAVTGGTGAYDGATGSFSSVGDENSKDTFQILVPVK